MFVGSEIATSISVTARMLRVMTYKIQGCVVGRHEPTPPCLHISLQDDGEHVKKRQEKPGDCQQICVIRVRKNKARDQRSKCFVISQVSIFSGKE